MKGELKVLKQGGFSSIQDLGRIGYRKYGVPLSGALDMASARRANQVLGNGPEDAVLEVTLSGAEFEFSSEVTIALAGANLSAELNGESIEAYGAYDLQAGNVLSFGSAVNGVRAYIAVPGGFQNPSVLGSRSMYQGITDQYWLKKGQSVHYQSKRVVPVLKGQPQIGVGSTLMVHKGPEWGKLSEGGRQALFDQEFEISDRGNRMGINLMAEEPVLDGGQILSSAVQPGIVQLPASGQPMVLHRDCQTTGGYYRVLQLTEAALDVLAQKRPGDSIRFRMK